MSKVETTSVKRFTESYDKLCKSCPTRLQPRVDTLTEMILGLPSIEREELMENVARRLNETQEVEATGCRRVLTQRQEPRRIRSARDVYEFQTGMVEEPDENSQQTMNGGMSANKKYADANNKLLKKMDKTRAKYESNKKKAARARRLLAVTNALLARDDARRTNYNEPTIYKVSNPLDNGWYHDIDALKRLSRAELKMERLKFNVQRSKFDSKVAKARLKLYGASMELNK